MFTVVGLRHVTGKATGVCFVELHCLSTDRFVDGNRCDTFFVRLDMINGVDGLSVGSTLHVVFNRLGRVDHIDVLV